MQGVNLPALSLKTWESRILIYKYSSILSAYEIGLRNSAYAQKAFDDSTAKTIYIGMEILAVIVRGNESMQQCSDPPLPEHEIRW